MAAGVWVGRDPRAKRGSHLPDPPQSARPSSSPPPAWSFVCSRHFQAAVTPASGRQPRAPPAPPGPPTPGPAAGAAQPRGSDSARSPTRRVLRGGPEPGVPGLWTVRVCSNTDAASRTPHATATHAHPRGVRAPFHAIPSPRSPVSRPGDGDCRDPVPGAEMLCMGQGCRAWGRSAVEHPCPGLAGPRGSGAVPARRRAPAPPQCGQRPGECRLGTRVRPCVGMGRRGGSVCRGAGGTPPAREGTPRTPRYPTAGRAPRAANGLRPPPRPVLGRAPASPQDARPPPLHG